MRVAYVTLYDANDVTRMSGTGYNIARAFEDRGVQLHPIGPLRMQFNPVNIARYAVNRYLWGKNDHPQRDPGFLRHYSQQVEAQLAQVEVDVAFGSGGLPLACLESDVPIVVWTDCTFANLLDYYGNYTNLSRRSIRDGHAADRNLYRRCTRVIFASNWAADSAVNDYGLDRARAVIVSRGANVPGGRTRQDIERLIDARPTDRCRLLFVGLDWVRKGGDIALEAAGELNRRGLPTELTVVGPPIPPAGTMPDFVRHLGPIRKTTDEGMLRFTKLLEEAHFLILPTRAEAFGIVFGEASAFGVPSLAPRTGGVPDAIHDGVNGRLFDLADRGDAYADVIEALFRDPAAYRDLARSAFAEHESRLNWDVAGRAAVEVLAAAAREGAR